MKTENLAIVFVDIAGYTPRTSAQTREENGRMLRRFDSIVRPLARAFKGRVVKTIGDAYLLTFRSPTDAVLCSAAIHDRLFETDKEIEPSEHFTIRAAINAGDVRVDGGDVFGEAVNIAARIEGKAGAGEIYFSEAVFLSMTKSEIPYKEVGLVELKGITDKVRIYRVPRAAESGYQPKHNGEKNPGDSPLPYARLGLDKITGKIRWPNANTFLNPSAQRVVSQLPGSVQDGIDTAARGFGWWRSEVRRSRVVQIVTALLAALLIVTVIWAVKPKPAQKKVLNPIQKLHRALVR